VLLFSIRYIFRWLAFRPIGIELSFFAPCCYESCALRLNASGQFCAIPSQFSNASLISVKQNDLGDDWRYCFFK
jgi:hypothetical protein